MALSLLNAALASIVEWFFMDMLYSLKKKTECCAANRALLPTLFRSFQEVASRGARPT